MVKSMLTKFWSDDQGALIAMEFLFVAVILVIGIIVGLTAVLRERRSFAQVMVFGMASS